jgi:hypothetical protein
MDGQMAFGAHHPAVPPEPAGADPIAEGLITETAYGSTVRSLQITLAVSANHTVYLLRSVTEPNRPDVGLTQGVDARPAAHNAVGARTQPAIVRGALSLPSY